MMKYVCVLLAIGLFVVANGKEEEKIGEGCKECCAHFYKDNDFKGDRIKICGDVKKLPKHYNNAISSLKVPDDMKAEVYKGEDFKEKHRKFEHKHPKLTHGWNNVISSIKVHHKDE